MTVRYVGVGGNDANDGLSWANRKLTLNGVEDTPVVAGDIVYVGPGTYRELLTVDVNGSSGNVIQYIGDYLGTNTDGVGGVVRVTGSDDDQTATRANCVTATTKTFRSFSGFRFDTTTGTMLNFATDCTNITLSRCVILNGAAAQLLVNVSGASQLNFTIDGCIFFTAGATNETVGAVLFTHGSAVGTSVGHQITNSLFLGSTMTALRSVRIGGITVKNCTFNGAGSAFLVSNTLSGGQVVTVNNCIIANAKTGLSATATTDIVENYNSFFGNQTNRTNVDVGANSNTYPPNYDTRWAFQLMFAGAGPSDAEQVISPFDLASFSQLVNLAGTSPTSTDLRGTGTLGAQREWGALEYDSTLKIAGGGGAGGGAVFSGRGGVVN